MSKALQYPTGACRDAMDACFDFPGANRASFDPETRTLISVMTKIANETEAGLGQNARPMLAVGVLRDELIAYW